MKSLAEQVEREHKQQMAKAVENLQVVQEEHKREIQEMQEKTKQQSWHQILNYMSSIWNAYFNNSAVSNWNSGKKC